MSHSSLIELLEEIDRVEVTTDHHQDVVAVLKGERIADSTQSKGGWKAQGLERLRLRIVGLIAIHEYLESAGCE